MAERSAKDHSPAAPISTATEPHEAAVITAALAILGARLRERGVGVFDSPAKVRQFLVLQLAARDREAFGAMFLDAQSRLITFEVMFEGTLTQTSVYPRELARRALQLNAASVILAHNHPSGEPEPSRADEYLTRSIQESLALLDVRTLDHIVVGGPNAVSFAERGLM